MKYISHAHFPSGLLHCAPGDTVIAPFLQFQGQLIVGSDKRERERKETKLGRTAERKGKGGWEGGDRQL